MYYNKFKINNMSLRLYKPLVLGALLLSVTVIVMAQNGKPVEKNKANSNYEPAFPGQTRIGSVKTNTPYTATVISSELKGSWGMHVLPDGRLFISSKPGTMQILTTKGKIVKTITGFPAVKFAGQGGLLDVNIDPHFTTNRMIYWTYAEPGDGSTLAVAKGNLVE